MASWKHPYPRRHIQPKFKIPIVAKPTIGQVRLESETLFGRVMTTDDLLDEMRNELGRNDRVAAE